MPESVKVSFPTLTSKPYFETSRFQILKKYVERWSFYVEPNDRNSVTPNHFPIGLISFRLKKKVFLHQKGKSQHIINCPCFVQQWLFFSSLSLSLMVITRQCMYTTLLCILVEDMCTHL